MAAFEVVGTVGGVSIALSLIPQVIKTYRSKSAQDISYAYQFIYIFGCTLVNTYAIALGLWPVYVPCLIEQTLITTLTVMKFAFDRNDPTSKNSTEENYIEESNIIDDDTGRTDDNDDNVLDQLSSLEMGVERR